MLQLRNVRKARGGREVLKGLSLTVERGEIYGLAGPNGSGKSTALSILSGLLEPDSGEVSLWGEAPGRHARGLLGVAEQEPAVYHHLTVEENLVFMARLFGLSRRAAAERALAVIRQMGLGTYAGRPAGALSGGWRRRLHVAMALAHGPRGLILDEPEAGLDPEARERLRGVLSALAGQGMAILVATHHLEGAETLCTRVGILHRGGLAADGSPEELRRLVPGRLVASVLAGDRAALERRAEALGWPLRARGAEILVLLPEELGFAEVAAALEGTGVRSLTLRPVSLADVYHEVTAADPGERAAA